MSERTQQPLPQRRQNVASLSVLSIWKWAQCLTIQSAMQVPSPRINVPLTLLPRLVHKNRTRLAISLSTSTGYPPFFLLNTSALLSSCAVSQNLLTVWPNVLACAPRSQPRFCSLGWSWPLCLAHSLSTNECSNNLFLGRCKLTTGNEQVPTHTQIS